MKRNLEKPNSIIDRALMEIRNTPVSEDQVEQAAAHVLATLNAENNKVVVHPSVAEAEGSERIRDCSGFQSLVPAYLSSSLTPSRKLLFEDHIRDCVACRKTLDAARGLKPATKTFQRTRSRVQSSHHAAGWAVAAALLLVVAAAERDQVRDFIWPIDVHAVAQTVSGGLFRISGQDIRRVTAGERIDRDQAVRTGNESSAVLQLADGSSIEMNARSEVSLDRARDGVRIQLTRGNVIVTAAKQRTGHLYVATADCLVSVVGTVFSVSAETKGSRVSVIEGEVHVQQGSASQALHPGQQVATNPQMGIVPVPDEIAWSRDRDLHLTLLKEFAAFSQDVGQRIEGQELRHTSNLIALVPANTLVLASLPNVSQPVADSYTAMKQRISDNPSLQQWWNANTGRANGGMSVDEMISRITLVGGYLGPEIILAVPLAVTNGNRHASPVLLADVMQPSELSAALQDGFARMSTLSESGPKVRLVHNTADLANIAATPGSLVVYSDQQLLVASTDAGQIRTILASQQQSGMGGFASTALFQRVSQAYSEGVGWLLAADLHQLVQPRQSTATTMDTIGDVQQFVVEQKTGSSGVSYRAVLGFNQARTGMASWLASPGPVGALEFVSPNAYGAAAIVTKDPKLIVDDIFAMLQKNPDALQTVQRLEEERHVDIRYDLAGPLGNEFLVAVDGPILPTPSWKFVIEVNDATRLQNAIQWAVTQINLEAAAHQLAPVTLSTEATGGQTYYQLKSTQLPTEVHYTFWDGYMIVAPSQALLDEAIKSHDTHSSLAYSEHFRSQLPADGRDTFSGVMYQNLQSVANALPVQGIRQTVGNTLPSLVCLYGDTDRIMMSSNGVLGTNIASMAGLTGMMKAIGMK